MYPISLCIVLNVHDGVDELMSCKPIVWSTITIPMCPWDKSEIFVRYLDIIQSSLSYAMEKKEGGSPYLYPLVVIGRSCLLQIADFWWLCWIKEDWQFVAIICPKSTRSREEQSNSWYWLQILVRCSTENTLLQGPPKYKVHPHLVQVKFPTISSSSTSCIVPSWVTSSSLSINNLSPLLKCFNEYR